MRTSVEALIWLNVGACLGCYVVVAVPTEVTETIGMDIHTGAGPAVIYAAKAVEVFDQFAVWN
jgi:hypothetical protein